MCTENRVSENYLSMEDRSKKSILDMDNGKCIPDSSEYRNQLFKFGLAVSTNPGLKLT